MDGYEVLYTIQKYDPQSFEDICRRIKEHSISVEELNAVISYYQSLEESEVMVRHKSKSIKPLSNKQIIRNQLYLFQDGIDILTLEPFRKAPSFHHILKEEYGGKYDFQNGILLNYKTHSHLHNVIENKDKPLFDLITDCLFLYKEAKQQNSKDILMQWDEEVVPAFTKSLKRGR